MTYTRGARGQLGVKVFGDDANRVEHDRRGPAFAGVPGARDAFAERATGASYLDVRIDRARVARYGSRVEDVDGAAVGGASVSQAVEGRRHSAINVRHAREFRDNPEAVSQALLVTSTGAQVPLAEVVTIGIVHAVWKGRDLSRAAG